MKDIEYSTSTALVTGGSSGIGRAIANELAKRGVYRLILVAQNEERLAETANGIEKALPGTTVRTIKTDLSEREGPAEVQKKVLEWDWTVDILVNNAGFARKYNFARDPESDTSLATVDLMVRAVVDLSLRFLPDMVKRGKGGILNVGSTAGYQAVPYSAMYAASKAFLMSFSQAIHQENLETGVRVACVVPGITETNLDGKGHGEKRGALDKVGIDKPENVAKVAVNVLEANEAARVVGWNNKLQSTIFSMIPDSITNGFIASARGPPEEE